jgi:2-desacetyl-2-hydroxyethyl bacteriochlorophyllide A dehydrogenase
MKAIVWTQYGPPDVLQLREVETPTPKDNEVLIKVHATTVTAGDCEMRSLNLPLLLQLPLRMYNGLRKPKRITILGQELAGEIESVGNSVTLFKKGDHVFAATGFGFGAYAEYICLPEDGVIARKPANMTFEEAAAVPVGGLNALHFLRKATIQKGQTVLINGAGGSIGTIAVQLAKSFGADVTGVDSTKKLDMLQSIGADQVIDYTHENFTTSDEMYDVIFDVVGKGSFSDCMRSLKKNGIYLLGNPTLSRSLRGRWTSMTSTRKVIGGTASYKREDLIYLKELIEAEKIKSVIDRRYSLEHIAEAHRYVETGQKKGNVVITVEHDTKP